MFEAQNRTKNCAQQQKAVQERRTNKRTRTTTGDRTTKVSKNDGTNDATAAGEVQNDVVPDNETLMTIQTENLNQIVDDKGNNEQTQT